MTIRSKAEIETIRIMRLVEKKSLKAIGKELKMCSKVVKAISEYEPMVYKWDFRGDNLDLMGWM